MGHSARLAAPPARPVLRTNNQTRKDIRKNKLSTKSMRTERFLLLCFLVGNKGLTNELRSLSWLGRISENTNLTEYRLLEKSDCGLGFKNAAIHLFYRATVWMFTAILNSVSVSGRDHYTTRLSLPRHYGTIYSQRVSWLLWNCKG